MTSTLAFLSRSTRTLLFMLPALATLQAEIVEFDLDQVPMPASGSVGLALPYNEQGLRLESSISSCFVVGPSSNSFSGVKAFTPASQANGQTTTMQLYSPAGRFFAVRSATIHPYISGQSVSIGFTRFFNGNGSTQGQSTGTALAGTTVTFNSNFNRVGNLSWQMTSTGGIYQRFQISRIVIEFDGTLTTSSFMVAEAAGTAAVPIQLDSPRTTDTTVNWEVTGVTASQPGDFTFPGGTSTGTVTIPAGPNPPAWMARRAVMNGGSADPGLRLVVPTPLPSDVRIIFSQSADLGSWTEQTRRTGFALGSLWSGSGSARVIESSGSSGRTITLRASVPTGPRPKLFLRNTYEYVSGGGAS